MARVLREEASRPRGVGREPPDGMPSSARKLGRGFAQVFLAALVWGGAARVPIRSAVPVRSVRRPEPAPCPLGHHAEPLLFQPRFRFRTLWFARQVLLIVQAVCQCMASWLSGTTTIYSNGG